MVDLSSLQGKLEKAYRKEMECELPALIDPDIPPIDEISYLQKTLNFTQMQVSRLTALDRHFVQ